MNPRHCGSDTRLGSVSPINSLLVLTSVKVAPVISLALSGLISNLSTALALTGGGGPGAVLHAPARAHTLAANRTAVLEPSLDIASFLLLVYPVADPLSVRPAP